MDYTRPCLTDHVALLGRVPTIEELNNTRIRMSEMSAKIAEIILKDTCFLHGKECDNYNKQHKNKGKQMMPYLNVKTTEEVLNRIESYSFNQVIIASEGIQVTFVPNGHLSGSASILFEIIDGEFEKHTILFSGDTSGTKPILFTKPLEIKGMKINTIISEATYNNKLIPKNDFQEKMEQYIKETCFEKRGRIIVPVFSVGRSTNVIYQLYKLYEKYPEFKKIKIYLASPMACKSHRELCDESNLEFYDKQWHEAIDILKWTQVEYIEDFSILQKQLENEEPCIYLASSGMISGGYSKYIVGKFISKKKNRVIFVGYNSVGTIGRLLSDKIQKYMTVENDDGTKESVHISATVSEIYGQSGHSDYKELCELWSSVEKKKLKTIILNHGDPSGMQNMKFELERCLPNVDIKLPQYNKSIRLY